jgi:D-alanyl-D-alanine carboxypeptidase
MEEKIIGIIPDATRKKRFFGKDHFNMIVTTHRIILVNWKNLKDAYKKYFDMPIDTIINQNNCIIIEGIERIVVEEPKPNTTELGIDWFSGTTLFSFSDKSMTAKEAKAMLIQAFGNTVK